MSGAPSPSSPLIISYILFFTTTTTLFFFFFFVLPIAGQSAGGESVRNTRDPRCYSFYCGDVEIRYPFWNSSDAGTGYCGYPNMGIHCHDGSQAILTLGGGLYRVSDVRYNTSTVTLQDVDVLGSDCPRAVHNLTLAESVPLAETEADDNLLFFFNCSGVLHLPDEYKIPCLARNGSNDSYVFQEGSMPPEAYPWGLCQRFLMLPVLRTAIPPSTAGDLLSSFGRALQRGFQLQWRQPSMVDCVSCEASGGNCGYTYNEAAQGYDFLCSCNDGTRARNCREGATRRKKILIGIIIMGISGFVLLSSVIFWYWHRTNSPKARAIFNRKSKTTQNVEAFLEQYGSAVPKRYAYAEVKRITKSFSEKLGHGGCGVVFKGKLLDGRLVAVKVLNKSKDNIEEFVNEVASIGLTHHVNIVSLLGFCCEGSKRALVYEFMNNGSLDKFIFSKAPQDMTPVRWDKLYNIAIGIARGLEYLHRGCSTRIVHFDIKPHNILLDEDLCPKISDFGLAKSCHPNQSILPIADARGTVGYIAPEVFSRNFGVITSKSDVYSYGMMMLDMVGGGRNADASTDDASDMYFPHWVYEHFNEDDVLKPCGVTAETEEIARKMILVGLWCVQTNPSCRPSMRKVVEMLEGNVMDLQMPPKPYLSSPPLRSSINS